MRSDQAREEAPNVQNNVGLQLIIRARDTCRVQLIAKVVRCDDVPSDAGKWAGRHSDQKSFSSYGVLDDLYRRHCAVLFLPSESVNDLLVDGKDDGIRLIAVGIGLRYG